MTLSLQIWFDFPGLTCRTITIIYIYLYIYIHKTSSCYANQLYIGPLHICTYICIPFLSILGELLYANMYTIQVTMFPLTVKLWDFCEHMCTLLNPQGTFYFILNSYFLDLRPPLKLVSEKCLRLQKRILCIHSLPFNFQINKRYKHVRSMKKLSL